MFKILQKSYFKSDCLRKKQKKLNIQASTIKGNRAIEFYNNNVSFQANKAIKLFDNTAIVIENSQILKDKWWFINSYAFWYMIFDKNIFISII